MIYKRQCIITSLGRNADMAKYGDESIRINLSLEDVEKGCKYTMTDLDIPLEDDGYLRLLKAFRAKEPIDFQITVKEPDE